MSGQLQPRKIASMPTVASRGVAVLVKRFIPSAMAPFARERAAQSHQQQQDFIRQSDSGDAGTVNGMSQLSADEPLSISIFHLDHSSNHLFFGHR